MTKNTSIDIKSINLFFRWITCVDSDCWKVMTYTLNHTLLSGMPDEKVPVSDIVTGRIVPYIPNDRSTTFEEDGKCTNLRTDMGCGLPPAIAHRSIDRLVEIRVLIKDLWIVTGDWLIGINWDVVKDKEIRHAAHAAAMRQSAGIGP